MKYFASFWQSFPARRALPCAAAFIFVLQRLRLHLQCVYPACNNTLWPSKSTHWFFRVHRLRIRVDTLCPKEVFYIDANKYRTAYDKAQAVQHEVWTELCQHLEHAPDAQLLSDYTATLVYTLDKDRREEALRLLRGQLYSRQLRDTGRVESWFTDCGARMGQDIEGFVANARQQYVQAGLAEEQRAEAEAKQKAGRGRFRIRPASAFAPERAAYLVQPYLPRGMVSILGGVSAAGKTSLALDVCARLTRGAAFAPDTPPQPPATVLYLTAENDPNKVLRPRAEAMGADLDRLYFQDGASYSMGDEELAALCRVYRPALLVFDPIQSYLGQGVQMNRAEQVRPLLDHLGALAKELDMAVLLISHMSKPGPGVCSALDRLLGSSDFRNAARSILIAGRDPEHPEVRVVAHAKNSLGQPGESQRYRICPQGTVAYDGPCTLTADAIIREAGTPATGNGRPSAALANAIEALEKQLSFVGWVEAGEVYRLCAERDISDSTIRRARIALDLKLLRVGKPPNQKIYWHRPELEPAAVAAEIINLNKQTQLPL